MPNKDTSQIKIWNKAYEYLAQVKDAYRDLGDTSTSMASLASNAILSIPMPTGNGHRPDCPPCAEEEEKP
jgi:hypothetical protein